MTKSTQNLLVILMLVAVCVTSILAQNDPNPVLDYYWQKGADAFTRTSPRSAQLSYVLSTRTFFHQVNSRGEVVKTDTVLADVEFVNGVQSSYTVVAGDSDRVSSLDLFYPDVFDSRYQRNFFPNDTGGHELSIGLLADSLAFDLPDGLVVIDRLDGSLRRLYLHYPNKKGYKRFSRSFRFVRQDGFVFPDSVWEVGLKLGFLSSEAYRVETGVTAINVRP